MRRTAGTARAPARPRSSSSAPASCSATTAAGAPTSWEGQWRLVCETGTITWDGFEGIAAARTTRKRDGLFDASEAVEIPPLSADDRTGGHLGVMRDFLAAVQGGPPPETVGSDNILSLAMALGAIESAERGMRVPIMI
jgi:predicted dehydrogenase